MRDGTRADIAARLLLTVAALLPYWRLLTFSVIYITDDYFASDVFNGELPGRVLVGQLLRHGQLPVWTNQLCSGIPISGTPADPIGLAVFTFLPPAAALDLFVIVLLLAAAHGAYGLARRFGTDRFGALLAGMAFAGSGYIACQLKHLSIVATVVWLPRGLLLLDRVFAEPAIDGAAARRARPALFMALFGLVVANQALSGFPQSFYYCALVYGSFALFRTVTNRQRLGGWRVPVVRLIGVGLATLLGAAASAIVLLPLAALGHVSDRSATLGYLWSTALAYWPQNILTFLVPYINGDISDNTYVGPPFFWEDYGYVGAATFLLALYGAVRDRTRRDVGFIIVMTVVAYFFVLGRATPVFTIFYYLIPGMKVFRFPTRFLIVVDLGLALLGGIGLTRLRADLLRHAVAPARALQFLVAGICAATAVDLFIHQPRQNPMVPARDWLAVPHSVETIRADTTQPRTFTPRHRDLHRQAFLRARGWTDVTPYYALRDILEPNAGGGYWNVPSADCYAGIAPRWYVDVWGDHNREASLISILAGHDYNAGTLRVHPALTRILRTFGVSHVLSPYPREGPVTSFVGHDGNAYIYRIDGSARVRVVRAARQVKTDREAAERMLSSDFDPDREILLHDVPETVHPTVNEASGAAVSGRARVVAEDSQQVVIETDAPDDGFLLLADTFFPGWSALVDGVATPIYRADIYVRGIRLPKGRHFVRFTYDPPGFVRGLLITLVSVSVLLLWAGGAAVMDRRSRRSPGFVDKASA